MAIQQTGESADNSLSILIVDDDAESAALASAVLESAGHRCETIMSSVAAVQRVERAPPDVLLIDIMMPEMDGLELLRRIRAQDRLKNMPVVVVSAKSYEFDRRRAEELGADGFIVKPIKVETFAEEVARFVEDRIMLSYWGVHGTLPVPGPGTIRYGGNTPCVSMEFTKGPMFIFDAGTGIKALSNRLMKTGRSRLNAKIFISHPHWDHINALPFFVPLFLPGNEFEILGAMHGDKSMRELISAQMDDVYFPITIKEFGARVYFRDLRQETLDVEGIRVETLLLSHPGYCLGYKVKYDGRTLCYVTDNELYLDDDPSFNRKYVDDLTRFVAGADVLITDCTYFDAEYKSKVGWGHSCVSKVAELAAKAQVKSLHLFHHDPDHDDDAIDLKLAKTREALAARGAAIECIAPAEGQNFKL